jgi:hypothetical protein
MFMDNSRNETLTADEVDPRPLSGIANDSPDVRDEDDDKADDANEGDESDDVPEA